MRHALSGYRRYIATARLAKHRLFVFLPGDVLPDGALVVFARDDDYLLGVLQSRVHEVWALALGTQLESRPRYTPTTCFETFPLPHASPDQQATVGAAARELDQSRQNWLNEPEDKRTKKSERRTLTKLYNERPTWLVNAHAALDAAVFDAYGWSCDMPDSEILARLLELNLQRQPA